MSLTTLSGREFNQDIARAKRAAINGPVIITDRGVPAFVLQSYGDWQRQTGNVPSVSLLDAVADPAGGDVAFEPPRMTGSLFRPVDLD